MLVCLTQMKTDGSSKIYISVPLCKPASCYAVNLQDKDMLNMTQHKYERRGVACNLECLRVQDDWLLLVKRTAA